MLTVQEVAEAVPDGVEAAGQSCQDAADSAPGFRNDLLTPSEDADLSEDERRTFTDGRRQRALAMNRVCAVIALRGPAETMRELGVNFAGDILYEAVGPADAQRLTRFVRNADGARRSPPSRKAVATGL
jgi:hypothetical protein